MKKNVMMRIAACLLVCVLASTCGISGTFAKYVTTGSASDTARVAKWGVEVFSTQDGTAFAKEYLDSDSNTSIVVKSNDLVVAPGTKSDEVTGELVFGVTGTPEVATEINVVFTGNDIFWHDYHPIEFTLHILDNNAEIDTANPDWSQATKISGTLGEIESAINARFGTFTTAAGETLDALYKITWEWDFEKDNAKDTYLGDLAAKVGAVSNANYSTVLNYGVTITIEQVD